MSLPSWISSHPHPAPLDHHRAVSVSRAVIWYPAIFQGWQMRCCILYFNSRDELDAVCSTSFNPSLMFLIFWVLSFGLVGCASLKLVPEFFWLKTNKVCFLAVTHSLWCPDFLEWKMVSRNQIGRSFPWTKLGHTLFKLKKITGSHWFSCSVTQSCPTLWPHGLQHTRPSCPSPSPGACSNSCPLSRWCHPTISPSVVPFSSCLQSFPAPGSFLRSRLFASGGQSIGVSASVLPMNVQNWFLLGLTDLISLQSKVLSRVFSNTTVQKHQFFGAQPSLWSSSHIHTWLLEKL